MCYGVSRTIVVGTAAFVMLSGVAPQNTFGDPVDPDVPGYTVALYATVTDPMELAFAPSGVSYVGPFDENRTPLRRGIPALAAASSVARMRRCETRAGERSDPGAPRSGLANMKLMKSCTRTRSPTRKAGFTPPAAQVTTSSVTPRPCSTPTVPPILARG